VVVVPIYKTEDEHAALVAKCAEISADLASAGVRVKVDDRDNLRPGVKFFEWEKKGVPVRLAMGPRDLAQGTVEMKRRIASDPKAKEFVPVANLAASIPAVLAEIQGALFERAKALRTARTFTLDSVSGLLVAANMNAVTKPDGTSVPASLAVFRMADNGKLSFLRKYDQERGVNWAGFLRLQ